ncbi:FHA domain-containing protein, partial [Agrococcus sp. HG114]|uniref:FHA domain-containing protein n=1 Tax=Agrococcus sp. HG114 TaxID=2969757 RepID=UPI00215A3CEF
HVTATRPGQALGAPPSPPAAQPFAGQAAGPVDAHEPAAQPFVGQPAAAAAEPAATHGLGAGDHDGMTITAEQARRMQEEHDLAGVAAAGQAAPAQHGAPATGPLVLSTLCERGHVNAPGTLECVVCGAAVDDRTAAQRRRPEFAVAALATGERIPLGRGVVIGRRPRSRRVEDGRVPRLVTVESPSEDISRSHLELRVDDWNLVAVDLSSTNGTLLLREGAAPQRLRPEAATILQLGDRLDLGDGVVVTIEPAEQGSAG